MKAKSEVTPWRICGRQAAIAREGEDGWFIVTVDVYERWRTEVPVGETRKRMVRVSPEREVVRVREQRARLLPVSGREAVQLLARLAELAMAQPGSTATEQDAEMDPLPGM